MRLNRVEVWPRSFELRAQGFDVCVHRTIAAFGVCAPCSVQEHVARTNAARSFEQCLQQQIFAAREVQRLAAERDALRAGVKQESWSSRSRRSRHRYAPQHRAHAQTHLARAKRLHDVIIRAKLKPDHAINLLAARGEHDDRDVPPLRHRANLTAQIKTRAVRQPHIQNDQRRRGLPRRAQLAPRIREQPDVHRRETIRA